MDKNKENDINGDIAIRQKEISLERDPVKKSRLQNELQILNFRKQINYYQTKIEQLRNNMR